jgi:hypothetical protein
MKTKRFVAIGKQLLTKFPDFSVMGSLMVLRPLRDTLRGFYFESSAFSKEDFYINIFFMSLYIPTRRVHLLFGHRVGANKRWVDNLAGLEVALGLECKGKSPS